MDLKELDKEAEASALKEIKNMLQRSGQLEKVDQYIVRLSRKKTSDDNLLKNQLVKQLDGVGKYRICHLILLYTLYENHICGKI